MSLPLLRKGGMCTGAKPSFVRTQNKTSRLIDSIRTRVLKTVITPERKLSLRQMCKLRGGYKKKATWALNE